jgi:2-haloacid dehalogenase
MVWKPSAEIFRRLATRYALDPARTLFIDDAAVNVEGARAAGFVAHHFTSAAALADVLAPLIHRGRSAT